MTPFLTERTVMAVRRQTIRDIEKAVCARFQLTAEELKSPCRKRRIARPRQVLMYLARQHTDASYPQIGRYLGGRDHTTILYGQRKITALLRETNTMAMEMEGVRDILEKLTPHRRQIAISLQNGLGVPA